MLIKKENRIFNKKKAHGKTATARNANGFAMIEALVAAALLSMAMLGTAGFLMHVIRVNQNAEHLVNAASLARDGIETFKGLPYDSIAGFSDSASVYQRVCDVATDVPGPGMKTVTSTVQWAWRGADREIILKTIIARE